MNLYYADIFELPLPERHRFPMAKYRLLRERLAATGEFTPGNFKIPHAATDEELLLVHTVEYLQKIATGNLTATESRRVGFPWSLEMVERSRRSTGATICAARDALRDRISANLAGGTHHSFSDSAEGYCVFNDVCVAARILQREQLIERALIVDLDVHQGNGTAAVVQNDASIFSFSMHCEKNFPFRKRTGDLDVSLQEGVGDIEYLDELEKSLAFISGRFQGDIVFYLAGADPFEHDRLGKLALTKQGLTNRDEMVYDFCSRNELPVAVSMAGGYADDVNNIVDIHSATILTGKRMLAAVASSPDNSN